MDTSIKLWVFKINQRQNFIKLFQSLGKQLKIVLVSNAVTNLVITVKYDGMGIHIANKRKEKAKENLNESNKEKSDGEYPNRKKEPPPAEARLPAKVAGAPPVPEVIKINDHVRKITGAADDMLEILANLQDQKFDCKFEIHVLLNPTPNVKLKSLTILELGNYLIISQNTIHEQICIYGYNLNIKRKSFKEKDMGNICRQFELDQFYGTYFFYDQDDLPMLKETTFLAAKRLTSSTIELHGIGFDGYYRKIYVQRSVDLVIMTDKIQSRDLYLTFENSMTKNNARYKIQPKSLFETKSSNLRNIAILFLAALCYSVGILVIQKCTNK